MNELPYEFRNCSTFYIEDTFLESCKNFPCEASSPDKPIHFKFKKCHNLNFSLLNTTSPNVSIEIEEINDISFEKIYANKKLRTQNIFIDSCKTSTIHDCSLWHSINTIDLYFEIFNNIKNLTHLLLIPKDRLDYIEFMFYPDSGYVYCKKTIALFTNALTTFRDNVSNPSDHIMDMTLYLCEEGFDDVV